MTYCMETTWRQLKDYLETSWRLHGDYLETSWGPLGYYLELITFEILAAERLRLMEFDNRLIGDYFANIVILLI